MTPDQLRALAARLRDHAAMHESIVPNDDEQRQWRDDLLDAAEYLRQCAEAEPTDDWKRYAKEGETAQACIERHRGEQDALLTSLAEARRNRRPQYQETPGPTIDINIKIAVPANWVDRLDMQWIVEREIHADRWSWDYAAPQPPSAQADERDCLQCRGHDGVLSSSPAQADVVDALRRLVVAIIDDDGDDPDSAPGHAHSIPGIWDDDNEPAIAGKPCAKCAAWSNARAVLAAQGGDL